MRKSARAVFLVVLALLGVVVLGVASTITAAATMAAFALIVPGTGTHNVNTAVGYKPNARDYYMTNTPCTQGSCPDSNLIGIDYPAVFFPFGFPPFPTSWCPGLSCDKWDQSVGTGVANLNTQLMTQLNSTTDPIVIFGYSQGAAVVSNELRFNLPQLLSQLTPQQVAQLSGVVIGNIDRPNGGLFTRLGFLGHVPILDATAGLPTPTDVIPMTDIAFQYDGVSDFPVYPINILADLNAIAGFEYIHGTYLDPNANSNFTGLPDGYTKDQLLAQLNNPANQQVFNKTTYVLIPTQTLPIEQPFISLASATSTTRLVQPILDLLSPTLRVLIDTGYNRNINPGIYTTFQLIPQINPVTLTADLAGAAVQGVQAFTGDLGPAPKPSDPPPVKTTNVSTLASLTSILRPGTANGANTAGKANNSSGTNTLNLLSRITDKLKSGPLLSRITGSTHGASTGSPTSKAAA